MFHWLTLTLRQALGGARQASALALLGALAALSTPPAAHAALYVGTWDPPYGAPFTNLGWRGSVSFDVPASPPCAVDGAACVAGSALLSAQVDFYDVGSNATLGSISWDPATLGGTAIQALRFDDDGNIEQLATDLFPYLVPGVDLSAYGVSFTVGFALQFVIDEEATEGQLFSGPRLFWLDNCEFGDCDGGANDSVQFPPSDFRIRRLDQPVPEPGALLLVGTALSALAVTKRRRRG